MTTVAGRALHMGEMTWPEYRDALAAGSWVMLPVGSVEQHGPHLPLLTDSMIVREVCTTAASTLEGVVVAEPLPYGYTSQPRTGGGPHFPGTTNLTGTTFIAVVTDLVGELVRHGASRVAVVNGHFENDWFLREACDQVSRWTPEARLVLLNAWGTSPPGTFADLHPDGGPLASEQEHAGWVETSMMLHLFPDAVRQDLIPTHGTPTLPRYDVFPADPSWLPDSGSLSRAQGASAEAGRLLVDRNVDHVRSVLLAEGAVGSDAP